MIQIRTLSLGIPKRVLLTVLRFSASALNRTFPTNIVRERKGVGDPNVN